MAEHDSRTVSRRDLIAGLAGAAVVVTQTQAALAQPRRTSTNAPTTPPSTTRAPSTSAAAPAGQANRAPAFAGNHEPVALPFDPRALRGLSERMMTSHHDNNYASAVRSLNRVEQDLSRIDANTPPFMVASLRERELQFRNSKTLHEQYFGNLGGDGRRGGPIDAAISAAYGGASAWETQFRATGMGLGGGSGWVVLALELETGKLRTTSAMNHQQDLALSAPLLVMDMYEHAYQMDFGAQTARYIDAFFENVKWDEVNRRFERAQRASQAIRGQAG